MQSGSGVLLCNVPKRPRTIAEYKQNLTAVDNCSVKTPRIQLKILDIHILHRGFLRND